MRLRYRWLQDSSFYPYFVRVNRKSVKFRAESRRNELVRLEGWTPAVHGELVAEHTALQVGGRQTTYHFIPVDNVRKSRQSATMAYTPPAAFTRISRFFCA